MLCSFLAALVLPQTPTVPNPWQLVNEGKYLAALLAAESFTADPQIQLQEVATMRSMVGDGDGALEAMARAMGRQGETRVPSHSVLADCEAHDALATLVELARDRRIVILNEAHHVPRHRAFGLEVARALRPLGFTYLAMETLTPETEALGKRGYPLRTDGFYSAEPVFGDFVRQALRLGYQPVAYENTEPVQSSDPVDQINTREIAQCRNLMQRIFDRDPDARALIFVGYSHATEDWRDLGEGREQAWMAARLAKATGLDPLTIDQTVQTPQFPVETSSAEWRYIHEQGALQQPTVFRQPDGHWFTGGTYAGKVDLQVFHPALEPIDGRPGWLACNGHRQPREIPVEAEPDEGRVLVQAFLAEESDDAVPVDQVIAYAGDVPPVLMLPEGEYRVVVQDESGQELMRMPLDQ